MKEKDIRNSIDWASGKSLCAKNEPITNAQRAYLHYVFMNFVEESVKPDLRKDVYKKINKFIAFCENNNDPGDQANEAMAMSKYILEKFNVKKAI